MLEWTLRDQGRDLAIVRVGTSVRLSLDGVDVDEATVGRLGEHAFELDRVAGRHQKVKVAVSMRGRLSKVELVESGNAELPLTIPFVPPARSHARRLYDLREAHPYAFAARHVATSGAGLLGLGAVLSALLARFVPDIDWLWLPTPGIELPDWNLFGWVPGLFGWVPDLFGWVPDWDLGWLKVVLGVLVAVSLTASELERRKKQQQRRATQRPPRDS